MNALLQSAREEYFSQERRHNLLVSKVQTLATIAAIVVALISASLTSRGFNTCLIKASLLAAVTGMVLCVWILRRREFHKIPITRLLSDEEFSRSHVIVSGSLAKTYGEAIDNSEPVIERMGKTFDLAVYLFFLSLTFGALAIVTFRKIPEEIMTKPNQTQSTNNNSPSKPNSPTQTNSYGTETLKKSENTSGSKKQGTK